jgi:uncharacterized protein YbjT (DUF2867 family)
MAVAQDGALVAGNPVPFVRTVKGDINDNTDPGHGRYRYARATCGAALRDAGAGVTVLSRHPQETVQGIRYTAGDLSTGEGIEAAVRGAEIIVHLAGSRTGDEQKTRTLVSAAKDSRHIVLISVVGADRIPQASAIDRALFGYFGMKLATERVLEQSGTGWTTLRATQFHDLILMVARALAKLPVIPAPAGSRTSARRPEQDCDVGRRRPAGSLRPGHPARPRTRAR